MLYVIGLIKKYIKYVIVKIWPVIIKGSSTGRAPIQVNMMIIATILQNIILLIG